MADEPEVIRHQMEETRTDITQKLETLEDDLEETVHAATDTVSETIAEVKDSVQDTVGMVKETVHETLESVKSAFDIRHQVDQHPWLMVGGAVAVGYLGGLVVHRLEAPGEGEWTSGPTSAGPDFQTGLMGYEEARRESSPTKWLGELAEQFRPELNELKGLALGAAVGIARDFISSLLPEDARQKVAETMDHFTTKLGGKPIHGLLKSEEQQPGREPTMAG